MLQILASVATPPNLGMQRTRPEHTNQPLSS